MRMGHTVPATAALLALLLLATLLFAACGSDEAGLTRAEVKEIVRTELAAEPPAATGLTRAEVEETVRAAIAAIPTKAAPAEYTRHVVDSAVARYKAQGLNAALAHYNRPESVDGQWYVFIIDEKDLVIAHPDPERRGLDVKGWVGTDANGYEFGPEMLSATEEGKWVSYVYRNPESGNIGSGFDDVELKNVWVERRDELLFASGWYIDADTFTKQLVSVAVDRYREGGLAGTVAYFASPGSVLAGLEAAIAYYNDTETVDGHWFAFIGDPNGKIAAHSNPSMIGADTRELLGGETLVATAEGAWVESESLRVWVAGYDGHVFGSGWHRDELHEWALDNYAYPMVRGLRERKEGPRTWITGRCGGLATVRRRGTDAALPLTQTALPGRCADCAGGHADVSGSHGDTRCTTANARVGSRTQVPMVVDHLGGIDGRTAHSGHLAPPTSDPPDMGQNPTENKRNLIRQ